MEALFRLATVLIVVVTFGISVYFRTQAELRGGKLHNKTEKQPIQWFRVIGLFVWGPFLGYLINPDWVAWLRIDLPIWLRLLMIGWAVINMGLIFWMFHSLGLNISPSFMAREGATIVTHGPYRWIRHPLYTLGYTMFVALGVITGLLWLILVITPLVFIFLAWRVSREEANLIEKFGNLYREYMQHTGRYFPKLVRKTL